jgi:hypothetical protein
MQALWGTDTEVLLATVLRVGGDQEFFDAVAAGHEMCATGGVVPHRSMAAQVGTPTLHAEVEDLTGSVALRALLGSEAWVRQHAGRGAGDSSTRTIQLRRLRPRGSIPLAIPHGQL